MPNDAGYLSKIDGVIQLQAAVSSIILLTQCMPVLRFEDEPAALIQQLGHS